MRFAAALGALLCTVAQPAAGQPPAARDESAVPAAPTESAVPAAPAESAASAAPADSAAPAASAARGASAAPVAAAAAPLVTLGVRAEQLATGDGDGAASLVYTVTFTNATDAAIGDVRITQEIPPGVVYVPDTAVAPGASVLYSVDGGRTFGFAAELDVAAEDGTRRRAQAADYTHIRWLLAAPLDARATGFARFRADVR